MTIEYDVYDRTLTASSTTTKPCGCVSCWHLWRLHCSELKHGSPERWRAVILVDGRRFIDGFIVGREQYKASVVVIAVLNLFILHTLDLDTLCDFP